MGAVVIFFSLSRVKHFFTGESGLSRLAVNKDKIENINKSLKVFKQIGITILSLISAKL
jgi:hypothetical protein